MDGPGNLARRVIAAGADLNAMCREAAGALRPMYEGTMAWERLTRMPQWERVEVLLRVYECLHWSVEIPSGLSDVDRALWAIAHEMGNFHKNVLSQG